MRRTYIAGNWKMHKNITESVALAEILNRACTDCSHKIMIAPPFTALASVAPILKDSALLLGAQNMAAYESGAHTGEISVTMLKDIGVQVVILGHSERRLQYNEKDKLINDKIQLAFAYDLEVILCVGETLEQREQGRAESIVHRQIAAGLSDILETQMKRLTIAYEPVWAIGTGKTATPTNADSMHKSIRTFIAKQYSQAVADTLTIQYGGSVNPNNIVDLMACKNVDGALVGGASLTEDTFIPIIRFEKR